LCAWGLNDEGQLGVGNYSFNFSPFQIGASIEWSSISIGGLYHFALGKEKTLSQEINQTWDASSTKSIRTAKEIDQLSDRVGCVEIYDNKG
jgi:hypothetical protein